MAEEVEKSESALREEGVLEFWREKKIFEKTLAKVAPKGEFVFYEGPPTANGKPGIHHLESRSFKDLIPRYKTMRGYRVRRRAGWDTHGLPVELEVEKQLGFTGKKDIETYGIAAFNQKCRESVLTYIDEWDRFTKRIGYWVDQESAYYTFDASFMESVWSVVKQTSERGLLYKDYKVVPWCPRCETALSSHELAQGYEEVSELSVTAKFESVDEPRVYFLAWTTTPWTLPGNVALAVGKDIVYGKYFKEDQWLILAKSLAGQLSEGWVLEREFLGSELVGKKYTPLYPFLSDLVSGDEKKKLENAFSIYAADFVTTEDGTGIVHTAVLYGQDDFELGTKVGLPKHHLVASDGHFVKGTGFLEGRFVRDEAVAVDIIKDLAARKQLCSKEKYTHTYPFCWRCKTGLIYYARDSWFVKMTALAEELQRENKTVNWEPSHIRDGRMGEWLSGVRDWAVTRERYWATPLPVWESDDGSERLVIGSVEELKRHLKPGTELPKNEKGELDLHRPYIDDVVLVGQSGKELKRAVGVLDVWFDSGAMPFAQDHYPFENKAWVDGKGYPADFISEAIDQTRGWFYTLLAVGVLMGRGVPYKNVICLGHLLDEKGQKMSKSKGNVINPWEAIARWGVDTLRFWMYSVNPPGESKNYDEKTVKEVARTLSWLENSAKFYELSKDAPRTQGKKQLLDTWMDERVRETVREVTRAMDAYNVHVAARSIAALFEDLSQWYVRRIRDRVKEGDTAALETLEQTLHTSARLLAPFAPFLAESVFAIVKRTGDPESVHLAAWPDESRVPRFSFFAPRATTLFTDMRAVRGTVSGALKLRQQADIKVRQPLQTLTVKSEQLKGKPELIALIKEEVNVKEVVFDATLSEEVVLDTTLTEVLKEEGDVRELVRLIQDLRKASTLSPRDAAVLTFAGDTALLEKHWKHIAAATNLVRFEKGSEHHVEKS